MERPRSPALSYLTGMFSPGLLAAAGNPAKMLHTTLYGKPRNGEVMPAATQPDRGDHLPNALSSGEEIPWLQAP